MDAYWQIEFVDSEFLLAAKRLVLRVGNSANRQPKRTDAEAESVRIAQRLDCPVLEWDSGIEPLHTWADCSSYALDLLNGSEICVPPQPTPPSLPLILAFPGDGIGTAAELMDYQWLEPDGSIPPWKSWRAEGRAVVLGSECKTKLYVPKAPERRVNAYITVRCPHDQRGLFTAYSTEGGKRWAELMRRHDALLAASASVK